MVSCSTRDKTSRVEKFKDFIDYFVIGLMLVMGISLGKSNKSYKKVVVKNLPVFFITDELKALKVVYEKRIYGTQKKAFYEKKACKKSC